MDTLVRLAAAAAEGTFPLCFFLQQQHPVYSQRNGMEGDTVLPPEIFTNFLEKMLSSKTLIKNGMRQQQHPSIPLQCITRHVLFLGLGFIIIGGEMPSFSIPR